MIQRRKTAGVSWLISGATGIYVEVFVRDAMIVHGNAAASAAKIMAGESTIRAGFAAALVGDMAYLGATLLLKFLLKPRPG